MDKKFDVNHESIRTYSTVLGAFIIALTLLLPAVYNFILTSISSSDGSELSTLLLSGTKTGVSGLGSGVSSLGSGASTIGTGLATLADETPTNNGSGPEPETVISGPVEV